jgi:hypothetical protein
MNFRNLISRLSKPFSKITAEELAQNQLAQARLDMLASLSHAEYYDAMAVYNRQVIERLESYLSAQKADVTGEAAKLARLKPLNPVKPLNTYS